MLTAWTEAADWLHAGKKDGAPGACTGVDASSVPRAGRDLFITVRINILASVLSVSIVHGLSMLGVSCGSKFFQFG